MSDRPLTDAEERTLIELADRHDVYRARMQTTPRSAEAKLRYAVTADAEFVRPTACRNSTTLYALADRGLVETRERPTTVVARITEAGRELLAGMGD